jgi:hypothetical protein
VLARHPFYGRVRSGQPFLIFDFFYCSDYNDYMMAKSRKAFRRAALRRSKTARLFCHILLAMNIAQMIQRIICGKTSRFAARTIESSIVLAIR